MAGSNHWVQITELLEEMALEPHQAEDPSKFSLQGDQCHRTLRALKLSLEICSPGSTTCQGESELWGFLAGEQWLCPHAPEEKI